jgi:uncharacterized protein (DUF433 family)
MAKTPLAPHIIARRGLRGGKPCVEGTGITVHNVAIWHERLGETPDQIASEHDLTLAQVHAALAYYFDHRELLDAEIRADEQYAEEIRRDLARRARAG